MVNSCYKNLGDYGFPTTKKVYVIAEIGINHGGDLSKARYGVLGIPHKASCFVGLILLRSEL
jgi:sialic acid synthase SpsE